MLELILLIFVVALLAGMLAAIKAGFNEVIKGLEAVNQTISRRDGGPEAGG